jgi:3-isopropylmalate/(R)-2-methylmalate dehydratase large subunit
MPMTMVEKILARASGQAAVAAGDFVVVDVDMTVMLDMSLHAGTRRELLKVHDPDKIAMIFDHTVPAPDRAAAEAHRAGREFVKRFGITRFHDVGRDQGISHVIIGENGYALPGTVLVCSDSHSCAGGAYNCAARGVGYPDTVYAAATGKAWFRVGQTVRYDLEGRLPAGVFAKDVFLHIANAYGEHATRNVEFGGPGLASLPIDARRTLATMGAELSAEFVTFECDRVLEDYVRPRASRPFAPQHPDPGANYIARRRIDLSAAEPMVALPDALVNNAVPLRQVEGVPIHQAFIGSCANGNFDDLAAAAHVLAGKRVAPGVRLLVTPGSQAVYRQALAAGHIQVLMEAGAVVTPSTCGACFGGHMGVLGPGETCITASTRNFKGRMGDPTARIYMASPATVAASAAAGHIAHPAGGRA